MPAPSSIPVQSNVPKKRLSDSGLAPQSIAQPSGSIKRFKPEPSQKSPFSTVTNTVVPPPQQTRAASIPVPKDPLPQERGPLDAEIDNLRQELERLKDMPKRRHDYLAMEARLSGLVALRDAPSNRAQSNSVRGYTSHAPAGPSRIPANHPLEAEQYGAPRPGVGLLMTMPGLPLDIKPFSTHNPNSDDDIDDDYSMNDFYDDDEAAAALAAPFVQQVGVNIPASEFAGFGDRLQERDYFHGPQADPQEYVFGCNCWVPFLTLPQFRGVLRCCTRRRYL